MAAFEATVVDGQGEGRRNEAEGRLKSPLTVCCDLHQRGRSRIL